MVWIARLEAVIKVLCKYCIITDMVENNIKVDGDIVPTSVGQSVSVNILVGKRTIMEYLLSPIFTGFGTNIREI